MNNFVGKTLYKQLGLQYLQDCDRTYNNQYYSGFFNHTRYFAKEKFLNR